MMNKQINFKSMYRTALVALCLMTVGVGNAWGWATRTYDGNTKLYITNIVPNYGEWSACWSESNSCKLFVCLKRGDTETWCTPTLEAGSAEHAKGALYSVTPPAGTYDYLILTRASATGWSVTNQTGNIDFDSDASKNHLTGYTPKDGNNNTGESKTWTKIKPQSVTSNGSGVMYFKINPSNTDWWNCQISEKGDANFAFFFNNSGGQWSEHAVCKTDDYFKFTVPEGTWTGVILSRQKSSSDPSFGDNQWNQTADIPFVDGHNYLSNFKENNERGNISYTWENYVPTATFLLNGSMNGWNLMTAKAFSGGSISIDLAAHKTYDFKIVDGGEGGSGTWYGLTDANCIVSTMGLWGCSSSGKNIRMNTAGEGSYIFEFNGSNQLSVTYPTASHPNLDYVYLRKYNDWANPHVHFEGTSASGVAETSGGGQQLSGLSDPSTITNTATFSISSEDQTYFYTAVGDYPQVNLHNNDNGANESGNKDVEFGRRLYHNGEAWVWGGIPVFIGLDRKGASDGTYEKWVDFNSTELGESHKITPPTKSHYDFGGFYTGWNSTTNEVSGEQVIDDEGNWIASVADYTDASKHWIHAGTSTTLYAKWTEIKHDVTIAVSPVGAGSVQVSGSPITKVENIGYETHSAEMTAVPTNAAWVFKEWQVSNSSYLHLDLDPEDGYTTTGTTMQVTATGDDQTLTAVFEKRYNLLGSKYESEKEKASMTTGGMPGWTYGSGADFTINSYEADGDNATVEMVCTRNLVAGDYIFEIHDRRAGKSLGRDNSGAAYVLTENSSVELRDGDDQNHSIFFYPQGAGEYIFKITYMRKNGDTYYPTVTILRPHQANFGRRRVDIDGTPYDDNTGGTLVVDTAGTAISTGAWVTYGKTVKYTTEPASGYTQTWYTSDQYSSTFSAGGIWWHDLTSTDNCYAQFDEKYTTVTINTNNSAGGSITVGGSAFSWGGTKTAGVTTKRALVVTSNTGYNFTSWALSSTPDFELQDKASETDKEVTLAGLGGTNGSTGTLTANFTAKTYSVKLNNDHGGVSSDDGSATATYDATSLSVSDHADFTGWTLLGYWNSSAVQVTDENGDLKANVDGYTDANGKWTNDAGETVNLWAHWSRSVTLDDNVSHEHNGSATVTYNSSAGQPTITTTPTRADYAVEGYYTNAACTTKVMEPSGKLLKNVSGYTDSNGKWTKTDATTLYAKWIYVIYRSGDAPDGGIETFAGGSIDSPIEYRMKVHTLDQWYSLYLPFTVDAIKVIEDGVYYDIQPYYRPEVGGTLYQGHYFIRTPAKTTDFEIANFSDWRDPSSYDFTPAGKTPYVIRWHDSYFLNKYISFFGHTDAAIPETMTVGDRPTKDSVVNVYGNNAMVSGSVEDGYTLEPDYGSGSWLREETIGNSRTVLPFECYLRANAATTPIFKALRRTDITTGIDPISYDPSATANKVLINGQVVILRDNKMYNVLGMEIQ